jgi:predicted nucleotidyltransferase
MNTNKLKFTALQNQIFRLLCINTGQKLNQREIARILKVTPSGVAKALSTLEKENIVLVEKNKIMNLNLISLNRTQKILKFKQLENLKQIYELDLIDFLEETFPGTTIILFGSFVRGEDTIKSDIDIAIIGSKSKSINLEFFEKKLERQININHYPSFKDINKELKENLFNGIVLAGGIEL